jgi:hypothetical protein
MAGDERWAKPMSNGRKRRHTELRLDEMSRATDVLKDDDLEDGDRLDIECPQCRDRLILSRNEGEGGTSVVLHCTSCGYVYLKRS